MNNKNKPKNIGGYYADIHPGDIVSCQVYYNGYSTQKDAILIERYKNGWIVELESSDNKTVKSFSPDSDERLEYRLLGRPE